MRQGRVEIKMDLSGMVLRIKIGPVGDGIGKVAPHTGMGKE